MRTSGIFRHDRYRNRACRYQGCFLAYHYPRHHLQRSLSDGGDDFHPFLGFVGFCEEKESKNTFSFNNSLKYEIVRIIIIIIIARS